MQKRVFRVYFYTWKIRVYIGYVLKVLWREWYPSWNTSAPPGTFHNIWGGWLGLHRPPPCQILEGISPGSPTRTYATGLSTEACMSFHRTWNIEKKKKKRIDYLVLFFVLFSVYYFLFCFFFRLIFEALWFFFFCHVCQWQTASFSVILLVLFVC